MKIEICIINPYASEKSNEKLKITAEKIITHGSSIFVDELDINEINFNQHYEATNISDLVKKVENNKRSDAFIVA